MVLWLGRADVAGVVQAFIIAFYAEIYGFPLTLYALTRWFGFDVSGTFWDRNLWIYLTGTPVAMLVSMPIGYSIVFVGVALVTRVGVRCTGSGRKTGWPNRAPMAWCGIRSTRAFSSRCSAKAWCTGPRLFSLTAFPIIVAAYVLLARKEERQMVDRFGDEYLEDRQRVPMFFPRGGQWRQLLQFSTGSSAEGQRQSGPAERPLD